MLTIWDWEEESMGLHSKAFGQDVWNVKFSVDDSRRLTTSGIGHIRFWKMAATFTGLKLQGYIGKFGKIDLSDIEHFVELPDGKVISGTEEGSLLLWEGNFIKCRLVQGNNDGTSHGHNHSSCHSAAVTYLSFDRNEKVIISASLDGTIKWWDFSIIDSAEVDSDHSMDFELTPLAVYSLNNNSDNSSSSVGVKSLLDCGSTFEEKINLKKRSFVVVDTTGKFLSLEFSWNPAEDGSMIRICDVIKKQSDDTAAVMAEATEENEEEGEETKESIKKVELVNTNNFSLNNKCFDVFHCGAITGMDTSPSNHLVATCGVDGSVYVIDYRNREIIASRSFDVSASSLRWLPKELDPEDGLSFAVGFDDGTVKILSLIKNASSSLPELVRRMVFKPHNSSIIDLSFSNDANYFVTSSKDGTTFFFKAFKLDDWIPVLNEEDQQQSSSFSPSHSIWEPLYFIDITKVSGNTSIGNNKIYSEKLCFSSNDSTLLISCSDQILREFDLCPLTASRDPSSSSSSSENQEAATTFESSFPFRELNPIVTVLGSSKSGGNLSIVDPSSSSSIVPSTSSNNLAESNEKEGNKDNNNNNSEEGNQASEIIMKVNKAIYHTNNDSSILASTSLSISQSLYCQYEVTPFNDSSSSSSKVTGPVHQQTIGLYNSDPSKAAGFPKVPIVSAITSSRNKTFFSLGLADGSVILKSSQYSEVFSRYLGHNNAIQGVSSVAFSYDDTFLLSVGKDGCLVIYRIRHDLLTSRMKNLNADLEAGVYSGETVKPIPKQQVVEPNYLTYITSNMNYDGFQLLSKETILQKLREIEINEEFSDLSSSAYSIQENRLRLEEDMKKNAAGDLKSQVLSSIRTLRKDYEKILKENEVIPEAVRVSLKELQVDNKYFHLANELFSKTLYEIHLENAYPTEKSLKQLEKLKARLMNGLLMEEIPLSSFAFPSSSSSSSVSSQQISTVWSLRISSLNATVKEIISQVKQQVRLEELKESQQRSNELVAKKALNAMDEMKMRLQRKEIEDGRDGRIIDPLAAAAAKQSEKTVTSSSNKVEEGGGGEKGEKVQARDGHESATAKLRRSKRKERKDELRKHDVQKPDESQDDNRDVEAIKVAEKTIGDYKLKSADDYEVPEEQRINAIKKIRQMAMLEDSMMMIRLAFNEKFLMLRQLKKEIIFNISKDNKRIKEIDFELNHGSSSASSSSTAALWQPSLDPSEFPDDYDEVTEEELKAFINETSKLGDHWEKLPISSIPKHKRITGKKLAVVKNIKTNSLEVIRSNKDIASQLLTSTASSNSSNSGSSVDKDTNYNEMVSSPSSPVDNEVTFNPKSLLSHCVNKSSIVLPDPSSASSSSSSGSSLRYYEVNENLIDSTFRNQILDLKASSSVVPSSSSSVIISNHGKEEGSSETKGNDETTITEGNHEISNNKDDDVTSLENRIPILAFTKSLMKQRMLGTNNPSKIQQKAIEQRRNKLQFEKKMIQSSMINTLNSFHEAIDDLRLQRHSIISDLKLAEFKLLSLYQEYLLLQTFETKDNLLQQKSIKNKNDEKDNFSLIYENKMKLESKMEEVTHWNEKLISLANEMKAILPENHPYYDILNKIFKKKVKRNKANRTGDGEEEEEEEDDDNDDDDDDEDEDEGEEVEDICPPGCDAIIYEKILDLREKKVDTEEVCNDLNKNIEELKKTNERLKAREKQIAKETTQTEYEVTQFHLQKQAALNRIRVVIPLRISQLYTFEQSGCLSGPNDLLPPSSSSPPPATINRRDLSIGDESDLKEKEVNKEALALANLDKRSLVSSLKMKTHTLFSTK
jgi:WD40 repeat protein